MGFAMVCLCCRALLAVFMVMLHVPFYRFQAALEAPKSPKHDPNEIDARLQKNHFLNPFV